jgi:hypothetical protein
MRIQTYLVLARGASKPRISRATTRRPYLAADEALIRLELELPDDAFEAPLFTVQVEKRQVEVAVEAEDVEEVPA